MLNFQYKPKDSDQQTTNIAAMFNRMGIALEIETVKPDMANRSLFISPSNNVFIHSKESAETGSIGGPSISGRGWSVEGALKELFSDFQKHSKAGDYLSVSSTEADGTRNSNLYQYDSENKKEILAGTILKNKNGEITVNFDL